MATISVDELSHWNRAVTEATEACHDERFPDTLIAAIRTLVPVESVLIGLEQREQAPTLLYETGIPSHYRERIIRRYYSRGYLLDPFCLAVERGLSAGFYHLSEVAPDNFFTSEYYKTYYLAAGAVEDCYYILDLSSEAKVSISLYNGLTTTPFDADQLARLRTLEPMIAHLAHRHWRPRLPTPPSPPHGWRLQDAFLDFGREWLTEREREVCHLLLRGHSAKSSARELAISPETIRMHRKNLYTKLGVSSQAELFALFIDWLSAE
ncbi:response regulator transcription factor [Bisbaumannia pacifica]|uniref:Helix-turn-helix transcriptional regulator n=1 Tax=Bisbaumannia pacifica TaxID=77098 RepID=A0ABD4L5Q6_9GAMM|nr:LuxR family transcriptional regulator [Halomonas pacifica]MBH8581908.1 helix-turn-helix transcriptional regulator [Halomonas pacifica]